MAFSHSSLRRTHQLAILTAAATFLLILAGGIVWSTGSALACPDWPLCYGQIFPRMEGGVLFEHSHRLIASAVALLTVVLAVRLWPFPQLRWAGILALGLVLGQALLGGLTVLLRLPLLVRVAHLATSQAFFASVLYLAYRTRQPSAPEPAPLSLGAQRALLGAALAVYCQLLLGALVRHTGSGMACDTNVVLCRGSLWPSFGPGQLQMLHRYLALVVGGIVIWATVRALPALRLTQRGLARKLAIAAHVLLLVQISLGIGSIQTFLAVPVVTAHLGTGALLWADLVLLYLSSGTAWGAPALSHESSVAARGLSLAAT